MSIAYDFAMLISGKLSDGGRKTLFKERISPAGLMIPGVFIENVGQSDSYIISYNNDISL